MTQDRSLWILLAAAGAFWGTIGALYHEEIRKVATVVMEGGPGGGPEARREQARAHPAPPAKPVEFSLSAEPELENQALRLLYEAKYEELEQLLEQLRQAAASDPAQEYRLLQAYYAFEDLQSRTREEIEAWIQLRPQSTEAVVARSVQRIEAAWARRGTGYSKDVADEAMADFARLLELAKLDAEAALARWPDHAVAWRSLIRAACGSEGTDVLPGLIDRLLQQAPAGYAAHRTVMNFLQPRWGGSYPAMERYAELAQAQRERNPRLEVLRGYPYWAEGVDAASDKDYERALALHTRALSFGDDADFLDGRARALKRLLRFKEAVADMETQHSRFPTRKTRKALEGAKDEMREIAYDLARDKKTAEALQAYQAFLEVWPDDEDVLFYMAQAASQLNHYADAMRAYRRVIELNPRRFEAVQGADYTLARERRWEQILPLWDAFLELEPEHGEAWFEQGGTYFQMGNIPKAYANAAKACELKHQPACAWKQRLSQHPSLK